MATKFVFCADPCSVTPSAAFLLDFVNLSFASDCIHLSASVVLQIVIAVVVLDVPATIPLSFSAPTWTSSSQSDAHFKIFNLCIFISKYISHLNPHTTSHRPHSAFRLSNRNNNILTISGVPYLSRHPLSSLHRYIIFFLQFLIRTNSVAVISVQR